MKHLLVVSMALGLLGACSSTNVATQNFSSIPESARIVVVQPDIKYYRITAGGVPEPAPDWTEAARDSFDVAFADYVDRSDMAVRILDKEGRSDAMVAFERLNSAVGRTIIANHFGNTPLPSKRDPDTKKYTFDWSLGDGVSGLNLDGDYALFVFYRDYQASGGRVGVAVLAAFLNISLYVGHQGGFASLVNLNSGEVVWFNNVPAAAGNLRTQEGAMSIVGQLFEGLNSAES